MDNASKQTVSLDNFSQQQRHKQLEELISCIPEEKRKDFSTFRFFWWRYFIEYQDNHVMGPIREKLLQGLDPLSVEYINLHERLLGLCRFDKGDKSLALVPTKSVWTAEDSRLYQEYLERKEKGDPAFLKNVELSWGTAYTGVYGMYDLPPSVLKQVDGKAVIDAGAYNGDTLLLLRHIFKNSTCYCFEPDLNNFNYLCQAFKRDIKLGYVKAFNQALGDKKGTMCLSKAQGEVSLNESASLIYDYNNEVDNQTVEVATIDELVKENQLEVGFIKMDVEGFEPKVIEGAINTIKTQRPLLVIAFYHYPDEFYEIKPYLESLGLNYRFQVRRSTFFKPLYNDKDFSSTFALYDLVLIAYPE